MGSSSPSSEKAKRCRRILNRTSDYVIVLTESGTVDYVSPSIEQVLGYTPDELHGKDPYEFVHPADVEQVRADFDTKLNNPGVETSVTYRVRTTDGEYRWVEARGRNYLDDPVIEGILLSVRDITDRKQKIQELVGERTARSAVQNELASTTTIAEFADTICEEVTDMTGVAFAKVASETPEGTVETLASAGEAGQHETTSDPELLSVPVAYEGVTRGTLSVQLTRSVEDSDPVRELLEESAALLGYAMADDERRRALAAEKWIQFTVSVDSKQTPLSRAVAAADSPVTMTTLVPRGDDQALCYLSPEDPSAFDSAASEIAGIERTRCVGNGRVQTVVTEPCPGDVVIAHGGEIREARVEAQTTTLTTRFPDGAAYDPVLEALTQQFDGVTISDVTTTTAHTNEDGIEDPLAGLTDRQRDVLEVAYRSGYFEKPRANDATAVAETLDIARPTYDEILRAAQRNLLAELFGSD
jgi:PAS domain S-box-containing protein